MSSVLPIFLIDTILTSLLGLVGAWAIRKIRGGRMPKLGAAATSFVLMFIVLLILNMTIYASDRAHVPNTFSGLIMFIGAFWILGFGSSRKDNENRARIVSELKEIAENPEESPERRSWAEERLGQFSKVAGKK